jgi:hypothetical protein
METNTTSTSTSHSKWRYHSLTLGPLYFAIGLLSKPGFACISVSFGVPVKTASRASDDPIATEESR